MELFVSLLPVVLCVCFCCWLLALFLNLWHEDWLPLFFVLCLGTMWTCQLSADTLSASASLLLLTGVGGCVIAAIICAHRLMRAVLATITP